jgi:hypothetical protein
MTTSGTFSFDPSFSQIMDEACERAGIDPSTISSRHINSAKMSLNLMFTEWVVRDGDALYRVDQDTETVVASTTYFTPQSGTMDLIDMVVDYNSEGSDIPMTRMSRQDYLELSDKDETGRPTMYYVDQSNLNAPRVYIWPVPDQSCTFTLDTLRYVETAGRLSETLDVHRPWLDACCAGLALRLAQKYQLNRVPLLQPAYEQAYDLARRAGGGKSQVVISGRGFGRGGRMRRGY